ncbi:hypothetical protein HD554DRAFT_2220399 [Boletus coccyginus]|nr:hypothetical protein HD554DRAFT_2220399 [Boletus coccyginus]
MATTITASPLPVLDSPRIQELRLRESPGRYSAYDKILQAEQRAVGQEQAREDVMSARIVGYLLLEFHAQQDTLGDIPCDTLVKWVTSKPKDGAHDEHDVILNTGRLIRDKFIRLFRTSNVQYPPPSLHPSRPSFDTLEDMIKDSMERTGEDYQTSRKKARTFRTTPYLPSHDGYRCMITGIVDKTSFLKTTFVIESAHILNESTMQGIDPAGTSGDRAEAEARYASGPMAMLDSFGWSHLTEAFIRQGGVHEVWNLLSLQRDLHDEFDTLGLWFESTPQLGRYKICVSNEGIEEYIRRIFVAPKPHVDGAPMVVEFTSKHAEAPPPDPLLLALHATCARVAHMSGAAEFFDQLEWDAEATKVLAFDGSSASLLSNLMSLHSVEVVS